MTAEKALELLNLAKCGVYEASIMDLRQAQQLGIEALERIHDIRQYKTLIGMASSMPGRLLPSETKTQVATP